MAERKRLQYEQQQVKLDIEQQQVKLDISGAGGQSDCAAACTAATAKCLEVYPLCHRL